MTGRKKNKWLFVDIIAVMLLVALDQATKYLAVLTLKNKPAIPIIPGVLELSYLENHGAAFGMLQDQKIFFICMEILILALIIYVLIKCPKHKKYRLGRICLVFIAAGDVGNMIDRISQEYVVDFISLVLIHFPIFNIADMYVTFSTFILCFLLFFVYEEGDLYFLSLREKKLRDIDDAK